MDVAGITPPASTDNATVILWAVGVLLFALTCVVAALWRTMVLGSSSCEERNKQLDTRLAALETRQFDQLQDLAERGLQGLAFSTAAIRAFLRREEITHEEVSSTTPTDPIPVQQHRPNRSAG